MTIDLTWVNRIGITAHRFSQINMVNRKLHHYPGSIWFVDAKCYFPLEILYVMVECGK